MIGFLEELWQSVFTPGASPTLVLATHVTFALLVLSLVTLIFLSNFNIHLIALLFIALALWGLLTWFIGELEASKANGEGNKADSVEKEITTEKSKPGVKATATKTTSTTTTRRSRKV